MTLHDTPPRPRLTVQVGVTGHRVLAAAALEPLRVAAVAVFLAAAEEARRVHAADQATPQPLFAPGPPVLRCVSGLAAGADALLAEAALAAEWTLVAALPFTRAEFERDFEDPADLARFRVLLAKATTVCELDGARDADPYAPVGEQIVEQSDLLIAIWDGLPPRGPGGTAEVVAAALARAVPVALLPADMPLHGAVAWQGTTDAAAAVGAAVQPPRDPAGFPGRDLVDAPAGPGWAAHAVQAVERLLGGRTATTVHAPAATLDRAFAIADRLATEHADRLRAAGLFPILLLPPMTLGLLVGVDGTAWLRPLGFTVLFLALAALLVGLGGRKRPQQPVVAHRALAEWLRSARILVPLGALPARPGADWTVWHARAAVREQGLAAGRLDARAIAAAKALVRADAAGQVALLLGRASRLDVIADRLRQLGIATLLFSFGISTTCAIAVLAVGREAVPWPFLDMALALPPLAAAFFGLLGAGDYDRLSTRSRAHAAELHDLVDRLDRLGPAPSRAAMLAVARAIAETRARSQSAY